MSKNRRRHVFFGVLIILTMCSACRATTYYVDYNNGLDTRSGQSAASAFKHCPGDSNATGTAASTGLSAGDTVIFRGGVEYSGEIDVMSSGTAANKITYRGNNAAGTWGTGRARINLNSTYYHAFYASDKDHITILNFDIYGAKNTADDQNATIDRGGQTVTGVDYQGSGRSRDLGVIKINSGDYWLVKDCLLHEVENWSDRSVVNAERDGIAATIHGVPTQQVQIFIDGSSSSRSNYIEVDNCEFWAVGRDCMRVLYTTNMSIHNSNFGGSAANAGQNAGWFSVAIRTSSGVSNLHVYENDFHDGWQYEGDEDLSRSHAGDWLHMYASNTSYMAHDFIIERNFFYNNRAFDYAHGAGMIYPSDGIYNMTFRNNFFVNPHALNGVIMLRASPNCDIYNNTFVIFEYKYGDTTRGITVGSNASDSVTVKNNIFYSLDSRSGSVGMLIGKTNWGGTCDYNVYYKPNDSGDIEIVRVLGTDYNFAEWRATGQGANSSYGDPGLVTLPATGATSSSGNYKLRSTSVNAKDHGVNLSSEGFANDIFKTVRPQGPAWDIGAHEVSGGTGPNPPENLRIRD